MDKYEFNIKVEQIKKLISEGDYVTAMKIADSIDWSRVRNANLLSMVAGVYEKNNDYREAKDILLLAFERAPVGKRLLYKLTELSVRSGDIEEAEDFYHEFVDIAPDDPGQHLLKYLILKAKGAPADQLVNSLEQYNSGDPDERWLYELAELYDRAGRGAECVRVCDKIMLLFGLGSYSDKAMDLKMKYAPLSNYQMDLMRNMGRPEYRDEDSYDDRYDDSYDEEPYDDRSYDEEYYPDENDESGYADEDSYEGEDRYGDEDSYVETGDYEEPREDNSLIKRYEDEDKAAEEYLRQHEEMLKKMPKKAVSYEESYIDDDFEEDLGEEIKKISSEPSGNEPLESDSEKTKILDEAVKERLRKIIIRDDAPEIKEQRAEEAKKEDPEEAEPLEPDDSDQLEEHLEEEQSPESPELSEEASEEPEDKKEEEIEPEEKAEPEETEHYHMMIEAVNPEDGLKTAIDELKYIHNEKGIKNSAAKTDALKLNERGLSASAVERLRGKDLIIERAGDLSDKLLDDIYDMIRTDRSGMIVVLTDTPEKLEDIVERHPALAGEFDIVSEDYEDYPDEVNEEFEDEAYDDEGREEDYEEDFSDEPYDEAEEDEFEEEYEPEEPVNRRDEPIHAAAGDGEEMDIDEFAKYCCQYASEIDCSITGKSMLALYERIELMEEDSIPLTRENAEALIEEAADKAEKPPIGKRIKGMFNSKYDKNGLLILREEDFIN